MIIGGRIEKAAGVASAFAAVWPIATLLADGRFRNSWPCLAGRFALLLGGYGLCIAAVLVLLPGAWPFVLGLTIAALAYERWQSRPASGRSQGLPRGPLTFSPIPSALDPGYYFAMGRKYGPIFKHRSMGVPGAFGGPTICIVGHHRGLELLGRHGDTIRKTDTRRWTPFADVIPRGFIRYMDDDDHDRYRDIFRPVLGPRVVEHNRPLLRSTAHQILSRMAAESTSGEGAGTRPRDHMRHYTLAVFIGLFYGIEPETPQFAELQKLYGQFHLKKTRCAEVRARSGAFAPIAALVDAHGRDLAHAVAESGNHHVSVLSEILGTQHDALDDPTLMGNLICILETGRTDLAGLLGWVFKMLADNPIWLDRVRSELNAEGAAPSRLSGRILNETLRLEQSELLARRITEDVTYGGFTLPKGWSLRICVREGHRNPAVFDEPEQFNPDRFLGRTYSLSEFAPLGIDHHGCLGGHFIDAVGGALIDELARGYDIEKTGDGAHWFGHSQLEPSRDFRLRLIPHAG